MELRQRVAIMLGVVLVLACSPQGAPVVERTASGGEISRPKILRIALTEEVNHFSVRVGEKGSNQAGHLVNAFLARTDERGAVTAYLLEKLPSQDDGSWVVNSDGTMRTTLTLRAGPKWHDGQPVTAQDLAFAHRVYRDPDVPSGWVDPERLISSVSVRDERTIELSWREPYFLAGAPQEKDLVPLPRHLLEDLFTRDKQGFLNSAFFTGPEYVGAGPFRVAEVETGSQIVLNANPDFFLGKPHLDRVVLKLIQDPKAVLAWLLSGDVDFAEDLSPEDAAALRDHWKDGNGGAIQLNYFKVLVLFAQFREVANYAKEIQDVRVRRALMHAIDRNALAEAQTAGFSSAADSYYPKDDRLWPRIEPAIAKYPYDVRRAETLLTEAGLTKGPDGMMQRTGGQPFGVECTAGSSLRFQACLVVTDYWKRVGVDARPVPYPRNDPEGQASYPGFLILGGERASYVGFTSAELPSAANRWTGRNYGSYVNADFDGLVSRFTSTLNPAEQDDLAVAIERHLSLELPRAALVYDVQLAGALSNVKGIRGYSKGRLNSHLFNMWEWTLQ
jgi:peptide/nickel transport system substrate-binding protein